MHAAAVQRQKGFVCVGRIGKSAADYLPIQLSRVSASRKN